LTLKGKYKKGRGKSRWKQLVMKDATQKEGKT
jgi:hypothetical protein